MEEFIEKVKRAAREENLRFTSHAEDEMDEDNYSYADIIEGLIRDEVIEFYPEDKPFPSGLVLGFTAVGRPVHIVCAYAEKDGLAIIVTVYEPDPSRWIDYYRIRRK